LASAFFTYAGTEPVVMNWTFEFVEEKNYICVESSGVFNVAALRRMVEDLRAQPFWRPELPVLFDNRKLDYSAGGAAAIREAGKFHIENDARLGRGKAALLMSSVADFGLGRQYELLTDEAVSADICVFLDERQALRWLLS
jgi:hypothetical protein